MGENMGTLPLFSGKSGITIRVIRGMEISYLATTTLQQNNKRPRISPGPAARPPSAP